MSIKLRHLASLPFLLFSACSENDLNVGFLDAGLDSPNPGGLDATGGAGATGGVTSTGGSGGAGGGPSDGGRGDGGPGVGCDPLAPEPKPISWASIIAGGRSANGTVYAADEADGLQRVFVSDASGTLVRQLISGSGTSPGVYTFSVMDTDGPIVLQIETSATGTRMGVLQGTLKDSKTIVIGQDGEELTVLPNATIAAMPVRNLPGTIVVEYVATLSDGRALLVTRPEDDWTDQDFRLFLGPPSAVAERQVASVARLKDGGTTTIVFDLDGVQATAYFPVVRSDASFGPGPATLTVGNVVTPVDRASTPPANATYLCVGSGPSCSTLAGTIASQTQVIGGSCTAVVRLDWRSLKVISHAFVCGKYAPTDETSARRTASVDGILNSTGAGEGTLISISTSQDEWVFRTAPTDFGGAAAVSARNGLSVFIGSIVWGGVGDILLPSTWDTSDIGSGCPPPAGVSVRGYDLRSGSPTGQVTDAANVVLTSALPSAFARWGSVLDLVVLMYPRTVADFNPSTAEYVVLLNAGWLE